MSGFVYLIRMDDTDYYKVGVSSNDPSARLLSLQTGNPVELHLVATSEQERPYQVEREIHAALKEYQVRNEWFRCERETIQRIFRDYTSMAAVDTLLDEPGAMPEPHSIAPVAEHSILNDNREALVKGMRKQRGVNGKPVMSQDAIRVALTAMGVEIAQGLLVRWCQEIDIEEE